MLVTMNVQLNLIIFLTVLIFALANGGRVKRVVGGSQVECGFQPRVVSLRNASTLQHLCGATLLSQDYAVTAAHCVRNEEQYILQFDNLCEDLPTQAAVLDVMVYDHYNKYSRAHDIALLRIRLDSAVPSWLNTTVLPTSSFGISGECTIYGYGVRKVNTDALSDGLIGANVKLISLDNCLKKLGPFMAPRYDSGMLCVLGDDTDSCQGDSGGPLLCSGELQGVISHGLSCGVPGVPSVLTSIGAHRTWINSVIGSEN